MEHVMFIPYMFICGKNAVKRCVYIQLPLLYKGFRNRDKILFCAKIIAPYMGLFKITTSAEKIKHYQQPIKFFVT